MIVHVLNENWSRNIEKANAEANAQYTALAVNNLHHLADALSNLVDFLEAYPHPYGVDISGNIEQAKEVLQRIS